MTARSGPRWGGGNGGADLTVITTDNPRSEDPSEIIAEVERGAAAGRSLRGGTGSSCRDPAGAPRGRSGDVVVVAGRGHESVQEVGDRFLPFDDRVVVREELELIGGAA